MRVQDTANNEDEGFTLIELLVVIIIIGILAAIAIPVYLNQRQRAYDAAAKSDMRTLAEFEETYLTNNVDSYGTIANLISDGDNVLPTRKVTLSVVRFNSAISYCLSAKHALSPTTWYWDSAAGGIQPKGATDCPVTTTGTAGDSVTR
ncbi:MAG TPA: prepilin-type N-terminal cleavage/methylation domain-containing protein [Actinomycetes bacterium]|nr:prepilin-type N-terminal cleavage/methylation domain-containing protein [Actinomycetes bacterium]